MTLWKYLTYVLKHVLVNIDVTDMKVSKCLLTCGEIYDWFITNKYKDSHIDRHYKYF